MKENITRYIVVGTTECPKCFKDTFELRVHNLENPPTREKLSRQPFYYARWEACSKCGYRINNESDKVHLDAQTRQELLKEDGTL